MAQLLVCDLGLRQYEDTLELQRAVARARITGAIAEDVLLLVEHPPVVTLGRSAKGQHLLATPETLAARGIVVFEAERGGDVTFHGPGQLVGYPVIDLKRHKQDLHWYLRQLEEALIRALGNVGIAASRSPGLTGVWTGGRKIASIGVHARDWVTWHGFALNVSTDLSFFDVMVPCGIAGVTMTSVEREFAMGQASSFGAANAAEAGVATRESLSPALDVAAAVKLAVIGELAAVFSLEAIPLDPEVLLRVAASTMGV